MPFLKKKIIILNDIAFSKNLLIYIDKVENASINENSDEYKEYMELAKSEIKDQLYRTYDRYVKQKYEIDINYKALDIVKNNFN